MFKALNREHGTERQSKRQRSPYTLDIRTETETTHEASIFENYRYYKELQKEFQAQELDSLRISSRSLDESLLIKLECDEFLKIDELIEDRAITQGLAHVRYKKALREQRRINPRRIMAQCGLFAIPIKTDGVTLGTYAPRLSVTVNRASYSGVQRCNSAYCVHCAAKYRQERMTKISRGLKHAIEHNQASYFLTMTIPRSEDAKQQIQDIQHTWKKVQHRLKRYFDKRGLWFKSVRSLDTTFSLDWKVGTYHNHLHIIIITEQYIKGFKDDLMSMVLGAGAQLNTVKAAQKIMRITDDKGISRYCAKWDGLSKEMLYKEGKIGRMNPYGHTKKSLGWLELLGECERGNSKARTVYRDFITAVKSQKTISFSQNWEHELLIENDEDTIENEELWGVDITPSTWANLYGLREDIATTAYYLVNSHQNRDRNDVALEHLRELLSESAFDSTYRLNMIGGASLTPNPEYNVTVIRDELIDWLALHFPKPLMRTMEAT